MILSSETLYIRLRSILPLPQTSSLLKLHLYGDRDNQPNVRYSLDDGPYTVHHLDHKQFTDLHAALNLPESVITAHVELKKRQLAVVTATFHPKETPQ